MKKQALYQDKKWLQEEVNRLGTATAVAREYGWGKNTIARWVKELDVSYPEKEFIPEKDYQKKEWLEEKIEKCGSIRAVARKYGYSSSTLSTYAHKYGLAKEVVGLTKGRQLIAAQTYQDKYWMEQAMEEYGSAKAIAKAHKFGETTIQKWAKHFGINRPTTNPDNAIYKNKAWLLNQYEQGKSLSQVAEQVGVNVGTIVVQNRIFCIKPKELWDKASYPYKEKHWLEEKYLLYGSGSGIAKNTGYPVTSINRYLKKYSLRPVENKTRIELALDHDFFEEVNTEEKAYWLGFMMADGYIHTRKAGSGKILSYIGIKLQVRDEAHLARFKSALKTNARLKEVAGKRNGKINHAREICFVSNKMAKDLSRFGIVPRKTGKETISKDIPAHFVRDFVRGYFDGDGSSVKGIFSICCSRFMISQLKNILMEQGVKEEAICLYDRKSVQVLQVNQRVEVEKIATWLYSNATIYLDRKKDNYLTTERLTK